MNISERIIVASNAVSMVEPHTIQAQIRSFFQTLDRIPEASVLVALLADHARLINLENQIAQSSEDKSGAGLIRVMSNQLTERLDRAAFQQEILRATVVQFQGNAIGVMTRLAGMGGKFVDMLSFIRREVFEPLIAFYLEEVAQTHYIFRTLGLYKRTVEWFDAADLSPQFQKESDCERHLRRFLLSHGVANPFSQAVAAEGSRQDITFYEDNHPIPIEVKFQTDKGLLASEVAKGVRQAYSYASDLSANVCYFVMFNKSKRQLLFEGSVPGRPFFSRGGVGVYCISVNLQLDSPSQVKAADAPLVLKESDVYRAWVAGSELGGDG